MFGCLLDVVYDLDCKDEVEVFGIPVLLLGGDHFVNEFDRALISTKLYMQWNEPIGNFR